MSAVSTYVDYTTFQRFSGGITSIEYLYNPIHTPNVEKEKEKWMGDKDKDQQQAKELQSILQEIKKYDKERKNQSHQEIAIYEELLKIFESIKNTRGQSSVEIFRRQQQVIGGTQHAFEQDMADLNKALIKLFQQNGIIQEKPINLVLELGSYQTNVPLTDQQLINPIIQGVLKSTDVYSVRAFEGMENKVPFFNRKGQQQAGNLYRVLSQVQGKIDLASQSVKVIQTLNVTRGDKLLRLNELFKGASFTLKNYKSGRSIQIGSTGIFRVLYTMVNRFKGTKLSNDGVISLTYALTMRHQKGQASEEIEKHLGHLQVIYELTGAGQEYVNQDIKQLKEYGENGAKFLIVNTYNNDKIQVLSTKALLLQLFDNARYNHFQDTVKIGRTILNKNS